LRGWGQREVRGLSKPISGASRPRCVDDPEAQVLHTVVEALEAMRNKDPERLLTLHSSKSYTLFNDGPPSRLLHGEEALRLKLSLLSQVQDLTYEIRDPQVVVYRDFAVAAYHLAMKGILVYQYRFEGRGWLRSTRCTTVMVREEGSWKIIHEHYSPLEATESTTL